MRTAEPVCRLSRPAWVLAGLAVLLSAGLLAPAAWAEGEESSAKALEILKKADAAIKKVEAVRFESKVEPTGLATNFIAPAEGGGVMSGWNGQFPDYFHVKVETKRPGDEEAVTLEGGGTPETYFLIDHGTKKAYEDMDPGVFGSSGNALNTLGMMEYVHDTPFDDEIGADEQTYDGKETVAGVSCHKVTVVYGGAMGKSTWYFGADDYLPRRRIRHFQSPRGTGAIDIVLTRIETNPEIDPSVYTMKLPEGYEQIDDFAP